MRRVLSDAAEERLKEARILLGETRDALTLFGATSADQAALAASIRQLDEFFLLVIVGEFNAGKSAFINALVGDTVLQEGVTPTTATLQLLTYGETRSRSLDADGLHVMTAPVELLREIHLVDTPGTNAIQREHERLTTEFVPRADLVLFITSADRPFTESERRFLETIRSWGKKIAIVVNKVDIFRVQTEVDEVLAFVKGAARSLLGVEPVVLAVSARLAQRAKHGEPALWGASGFDALEDYLRRTLDAEARFDLKLANPLGVGRALASRYAAIADERLSLMQADFQILQEIERQLVVFREDLARGFELQMTAVDKVLADMEHRGQRYFEDTLRIGRVMDLLNRARVQQEFTDRVVADAPAQVERRVHDLTEWLVDQDYRQWLAVTERLAERRRQYASQILGAPDVGSFHGDRTRLVESVGREAQRVVDTYDKRREAEAIADQARAAVATTAAAGGAALGLGTLVTVAASTVAVDVTGILVASVVLGVGFLVIPARRRRAKETLEAKVAALRQQLSTALRREFERAQQQSTGRLNDSITPYARFVRAEEQRWRQARETLARLQQRIDAALHLPQQLR
jgi:small GTP-binding protein